MTPVSPDVSLTDYGLLMAGEGISDENRTI